MCPLIDQRTLTDDQLAFHYYIKSKDGEWIETRGLQDERGRQFPFVSYGMIKLLGFDDESIDCDDAVKCRTIRGSYHTYGSIELVLKDHHGPRKDLFQVFDDKRPLFSECLQPPCRLDDNLIITFTMWEREKLPKGKSPPLLHFKVLCLDILMIGNQTKWTLNRIDALNRKQKRRRRRRAGADVHKGLIPRGPVI